MASPVIPPATLRRCTTSVHGSVYLDMRKRTHVTIVIEIADDFVPGGRVFFTPARTATGIEWKCTSENVRQAHLVATCRRQA